MRLVFEMPPDVKEFLSVSERHIGEYCQEAVLSYMLDMSLTNYVPGDRNSHDRSVGETVEDLLDRGVLIDSPIDGDDQLVYEAEVWSDLYTHAFKAQYALNGLVQKYKLENQRSEAVCIFDHSFWCVLRPWSGNGKI